MRRELRYATDGSGNELNDITERMPAVDSRHLEGSLDKLADVNPRYTLRDQLFVEPQPLALPARMELESPIMMSRAEIAIARSHIEVWRQVAERQCDYSLILEDDIWFKPGFAAELDGAWKQLKAAQHGNAAFDLLYLSYEEVKGGAPKVWLSDNVFRPVRGLWNLSGYVLSRQGAERALSLLPVKGPIDLWLNHQFRNLDVRATRRSIISQRRDVHSANSYSILPSLTKIGAITSEHGSLFQVRPIERPVFGIGPPGSGLTSLAMAMSMLGYRCCSDLDTLPNSELTALLAGKTDRIFDAYVNIGALDCEVDQLRKRYPRAKFIVTSCIPRPLATADVAIISRNTLNKWQVLCEHLRCAPPGCSFPEMGDLGHRTLNVGALHAHSRLSCKHRKRDLSPWVVEQQKEWRGIRVDLPNSGDGLAKSNAVVIDTALDSLDSRHWYTRTDTFNDNLALFRPQNVEFRDGVGAKFTVKDEQLGVRRYSAAALSSHYLYLYGRFEANIRASKTPGVLTGFFLHRDSPRQEIDVEISGHRTDRLLVNVYFNPGGEGAEFDYGYRGAASSIDLGFDASESYHMYAIEWSAESISWYVDDRLVHRRFEWDPTPIPHLPMRVHVNIWPCRSSEVAGRLAKGSFEAASFVKSIALRANMEKRSKTS